MCIAVGANAASVGTETREGTDTKQGQTIENSQNIQLRKGNSKRNVTGSDRRAAEERAREKRQTDDISAELQGAVLFIPMLQQIEQGQVDTGSNPVAELFQSCRFFTSAQPVPVALGASPSPMEVNYLAGGNVSMIWGAQNSEVSISANDKITVRSSDPAVPRVRVSGASIWERYYWHETASLFRVGAARDIARCYFAYGLTIAGAMKNLAQGGNAAQLSLSGIFLTGYWVLVIRTSRGYRLWDLRGGSTKRRMFFLMAASLAGMAPGVCDPELHSHSSTM